jgi:hypothetical protein
MEKPWRQAFLSSSHNPQTTWKVETESQRWNADHWGGHYSFFLSSLQLLPESSGQWSILGCTQNDKPKVKASQCSENQLLSPAYKSELPPPPLRGWQRVWRAREASRQHQVKAKARHDDLQSLPSKHASVSRQEPAPGRATVGHDAFLQ